MTYQDVQRSWFFRDAWRWAVGLPASASEGGMPGLAELEASQWSAEFERGMRARMIQGAFRYGLIRPGGGLGRARFDRVGRAQHELAMYMADGRSERLIDAANMMLVEFVERGCAGRLESSGENGMKIREII